MGKGDDLTNVVSELKKEFNDFKEKKDKQLRKISRENSDLKKKIVELQTQMPTKEAVTAAVLKIIESKMTSIKNQMLKIKQFDNLLSKNEQFNYMLEHFSQLDKIAMTKKQYSHFSSQVDKFRKETAQLIKLKKELSKLSKIENELMKLSRKVPQLERKLMPIK